MTKINLTIKLSKNYQTVEIGATDIDPVKYYETEKWLLDNGQHALNEICGETNEAPVVTTQTNYQPVTEPKGAMASQKQVNFLRMLGFNGDVDDLSCKEADELIKKYKNKKES